MSTELVKLIEQLEGICEQVRLLDLEAGRLLHEEKDRERYRGKLLKKTELLASLPELTKDAADLLPDSRRAWYQEAVGEIAGDARQAMAIGSVFYMSVLLLPGGEQQQSANDLEQLIARLRS